MDRALRFDSLSFHMFVLAAVLAAVLTIVAGCAKPVPVVRNVVRDRDVLACSPEKLGSTARLDVAIVIETSLSTRRPSGIDVDENGEILSFRRNSTFDKADSRLAATIAALRPLVRNAAAHDIRFSIVTFSGPSRARTVGRVALAGSGSASKLFSPLTRNTEQLDRALTSVLDRGSTGTAVFYAGMRRALRSLTQTTTRGRRRIVLFLADGPRPSDSDPSGVSAAGKLIFRDPRLKSAALMARDHGVVFHTFGLSTQSSEWRRAPLGQIAGATGGNYHAVEDPALGYCHLANSLAPRTDKAHRERAFARAMRSTSEKK
jgi:Mg-chelatase subunit ChlD